MLLMEIKQYIQNQKTTTLLQLSQHFDIPASAMSDMVNKWITKGLIQKEILPPSSICAPDGSSATMCGCGGCGTCSHKSAAPTVKYRWVE